CEMAELIGCLAHRIEHQAMRMVIVSPREVVVMQPERNGEMARLPVGGGAGVDEQVLVHERLPKIARHDLAEHRVNRTGHGNLPIRATSGSPVTVLRAAPGRASIPPMAASASAA